jgi:GTP-binding protein EngB required for normal cell division
MFFKKKSKSQITRLIEEVEELKKYIKLLDSRIGEMAFDHQMFKHQISIEESLRNQESDIQLLKTKIEKTIEELK